MSIFIITGISGSGKSVALHALEDAGYDCVDNIPVNLLENLIDSLQKSGSEKMAIAIDARRGESIQELPTIIDKLEEKHKVRVIFLNASTETLVKRFSETRRRHPLSTNAPQTQSATLIEAIDKERNLLESLRAQAHSIDTSITARATNVTFSWFPAFIHRWYDETLGREIRSFYLGNDTIINTNEEIRNRVVRVITI